MVPLFLSGNLNQNTIVVNQNTIPSTMAAPAPFKIAVPIPIHPADVTKHERRAVVFGFRLRLQDVDYCSRVFRDYTELDPQDAEIMVAERDWRTLFEEVEHVVEIFSEDRLMAVRPFPKKSPHLVYILVVNNAFDNDDEMHELLQDLALELVDGCTIKPPVAKMFGLTGFIEDGFNVPDRVSQ